MDRAPLHPLVDAGRVVIEHNPPLASGNAEPPPRRCERCRVMFDGDPSLYPPARPDWWVCPPCRAILFGRLPDPSE
jgi:hypothetical protein